MTYSLIWNTPDRQIAFGSSQWAGIRVIHHPFQGGVIHSQGWGYPNMAADIISLTSRSITLQDSINQIVQKDVAPSDRQILALSTSGMYGGYQGSDLVHGARLLMDSVSVVVGNMLTNTNVIDLIF